MLRVYLPFNAACATTLQCCMCDCHVTCPIFACVLVTPLVLGILLGTLPMQPFQLNGLELQ